MINSIQYMRAIAAIMVVLHHSAWKGAQYSSDPLHWFHVGPIGVDLFFIISGYIMCHTINRKSTTFKNFMFARVKRIIPLYWFLSLISLVVYLVFPEKINSSGGDTNVIYSFMLFPSEDKFLIQNGWTLSYEFYFYFIFAFCLGIISRYKFLLPIASISILCSVNFLFKPDKHIVDFLTSPLLLEFAFGMLAFLLFRGYRISTRVGISLLIISLTLLVLINNYDPDFSRVVLGGIPALLFFISMLSFEKFFMMHVPNIYSILFKEIGNSSYSLYLVHPFFLVLGSVGLGQLGLSEFGYSFVTLLFIGSIVTGHLCYLYIEKPLLYFFRKKEPLF